LIMLLLGWLYQTGKSVDLSVLFPKLTFRSRWFFIVLVVLSCSFAYFFGKLSYYYIPNAPVTSIQLSDNRIFEGRVVLAVSRYIILLRDGGGLTILPQTGISRVMVSLPRKSPPNP
jgi:hypothetical protein